MNTGPQDRTPAAAGAAHAGTLAGYLRKAPPANRAAKMQLLGETRGPARGKQEAKKFPVPLLTATRARVILYKFPTGKANSAG